jgi:lysophospholipase L1-like esterase
VSRQPDSIESRAGLVARFFHLEKLPMFHRAGLRAEDLAAVAARLADAQADDLRVARAILDQEAAECAEELLADPHFIAAARSLPFRSGDVIVALGDSITDDAVSWAHILELVLRTTSPGVVVRNHGITGNTTAEVLQRLDIIEGEGPDWVIQMLGTNDARRHGKILAQTTSATETARNLAILSTFVSDQLGARHVTMTPPPTIDAWVGAWEAFELESITWRATDIEAIADAVRSSDEAAIDIHAAFTRAATDTLLIDDGVHPNADGQKLIVTTLVDSLSTSHSQASTHN